MFMCRHGGIDPGSMWECYYHLLRAEILSRNDSTEGNKICWISLVLKMPIIKIVIGTIKVKSTNIMVGMQNLVKMESLLF